MPEPREKHGEGKKFPIGISSDYQKFNTNHKNLFKNFCQNIWWELKKVVTLHSQSGD